MDKPLALFLNTVFHDHPNRQTELLNRFSSLGECLESIDHILSSTRMKASSINYFRSRIRSFDYDTVMAHLEKASISCVFYDDPAYPSALAEIHDAPLLLYYRGHIDYLKRPIFGIVGARKATEYGLRATRLFSESLSDQFLIASGMAEGVDTVAHTAALDRHQPTAAVVGTGLDLVFPASNRRLFERIIENGVVVSEFPPGVKALPHRFPLRNRIISGMSCGVVVTEAAERSGSLITARLALEENREVFALPGSIFSSLSAGCHRLIQDGAKLVLSSDDVLTEFDYLFPSSGQGQLFDKKALAAQPKPSDHPPSQPADLTADELTVWKILGNHTMSVDDVVLASGLAVHQVLQSLTMLEVQKVVTQLPGSRYCRK